MVKHTRYRCRCCGKEYNIKGEGHKEENHWMAKHRITKHNGEHDLWEVLGVFLFRPTDIKRCSFKILNIKKEEE